MNLISFFFLRKSAKKIYFQAITLAKKQKSVFSTETKQLVKAKLTSFEAQLLSNSPPLTKEHLADFKNFKKQYLDLKGARKWIHFFYTTTIALIAALIIRQMWFELYKVPTGSMRPTIKELDHLTVSKLNFSLNVPFKPKHFYFDPHLVKRSSICVFTSENMDVSDSDTKYFWIIPGKKLLVKRLIAKPGDLLYFYGGKIYGLDKNDNDITQELNPSNIENIDHIPFIQWYGDKEAAYDQNGGLIYHMNAPYVSFNNKGDFQFAVPQDMRDGMPDQITNMSQLWGLDNYATARILNNQTKKKLYPQDNSTSSKGLYLEFKHHLQPSLGNAFSQSPPLSLQTSILPLDDRLSKKLFESLYTARFEVKNGTLRRYGSMTSFNSKQLPKLHHIPDGTYEFYYGIAYKVNFGGVLTKCAPTHPIYRFSSTALEIFFNLGIEFNNYFVPGQYEGWAPPRYGYFRDEDLYVMGLPFLTKTDPALINFVTQQSQKKYGFIDQGSPLNQEGIIDKDKMKSLGLKIPEKMYFVLGDNHAQSADSRVFGFVPEENLKGSPDIIFWPPGSRWGHLPQAASMLITLPRAIIWSLAWVLGIVWYRYKKKQEILPINIDFLN